MTNDESKRTTKKFDPLSPAYRWRLWVKYYSSPKARKVRHFYWKRLGIALVVGGIAGWSGLTAAIWGSVHHRGFSQVRYVNLVLPWRWHRYAAGLSADYLARGNAELRAGHSNAAVTDYTAALALNPEDLNTRRFVAARQFQVGLRAEAVSTLRTAALAAYQAGNEAYLQEFFAAALATGDFQGAATTGQALLPVKPVPEPVPKFVAFRIAVALERLKNYSAAIELLRRWRLTDSPDTVALGARCEWESGHVAAADDLVRACLAKYPHSDVLYQVREDWARSRQNPTEVRRYARLRAMANPQLAAARLDELNAQKDVAADAEFDRLAAAYLQDFSGNIAALGGLANVAIDTGRPSLVAAIRTVIQPKATADELTFFDLCAVRASLMAHRYAQARLELSALQQEKRPGNRPLDVAEAGMSALIQLGLNEKGGETAFSRLLPQLPGLALPEAFFLLRALDTMGRRSEALKVQEELARLYPDRPEIRTALRPIES